MRPAGAATAGAAAVLMLAGPGCAGEPDRPRPPSDEAVIRSWSRAVNAGDFRRAGRLFAPNAIVDQGRRLRLRGRSAAAAFSAGLPCRADVTSIERRRDGTLARFRLRRGRTGLCGEGGTATVRFVIREGRIREWHQLPAAPPVEGERV